MASNDWKERLSMVYSTNPDFNPYDNDEPDVQTPPPMKQNLRVMHDKRNRGGKTVTLITGFVGKEEDLKDLGKLLKNKCGVGGTVKDGEIIIQGSFADKIVSLLSSLGYKVKRSGG